MLGSLACSFFCPYPPSLSCYFQGNSIARPFRLLSRMVCGLFLSVAFLPPDSSLSLVPACYAGFLNVHYAGYYPAFFSAPPQTTIRRPSVSSSFSSSLRFLFLSSSVYRSPMYRRACSFSDHAWLFSLFLFARWVLFLTIFALQNLHIPNIFCTFAPDFENP